MTKITVVLPSLTQSLIFDDIDYVDVNKDGDLLLYNGTKVVAFFNVGEWAFWLNDKHIINKVKDND